MSQIDFTSQCAGDLGVTLKDEVVCVLFIKNDPNTRLITHVEVHDIRKGGYPKILPTLAAGVDHMLVTADNYRTADMEAEIERQITNQKAEDARQDSYFASNIEHTTTPLGSTRLGPFTLSEEDKKKQEEQEEQELVAKFKEAGLWCLLEDKED